MADADLKEAKKQHAKVHKESLKMEKEIKMREKELEDKVFIPF